MEREINAADLGRRRIALTTTSGAVIHMDDDEIVTVTALTTEKSGECLLLRLRDSEKVWILDQPGHRSKLRIEPAPRKPEPVQK